MEEKTDFLVGFKAYRGFKAWDIGLRVLGCRAWALGLWFRAEGPKSRGKACAKVIENWCLWRCIGFLRLRSRILAVSKQF